MLGIVDNQLVRFEPVLQNWKLGYVLGENHLQATVNGEPITTGVGYFVIKEDPGLDITMNRKTGEFVVEKGYGQAKLRIVLGNHHIDVDLNVNRAEVA